MKLIIFSLIITILLESTIITLPLTLILILFAAIVFRKNQIFALAFFSGLALDFLTFRNIGWSSLFFVTLVFIVFLYQKKFEIETLHFIFIMSAIGSFGYLLIQGISHPIPQAIISCFVLVLSFIIYTLTNKKARSTFSGQVSHHA